MKKIGDLEDGDLVEDRCTFFRDISNSITVHSVLLYKYKVERKRREKERRKGGMKRIGRDGYDENALVKLLDRDRVITIYTYFRMSYHCPRCIRTRECVSAKMIIK